MMPKYIFLMGCIKNFFSKERKESDDVPHSRTATIAKVVTHKVIVFVALLLISIQLIIFVVIDRAISTNARQKTSEELQVAERIFLRLLKGRSQQLVTETKILVSDFAFRKAIMTGNHETIESALSNYGARIDATMMIFVAPNNIVIADASRSGEMAKEEGVFAFVDLIKEAAEHGNASTIKLIDGSLYQLVVVPVLAPTPMGWLVLGFNIDNQMANELGALTLLEVSFATWEEKEGWHVVSSNILPSKKDNILNHLGNAVSPDKLLQRLQTLSGDNYVTSVSMLNSDHDGRVVAVLQHSIEGDISRFHEMRITMLILASMSLVGTVLGSVMIARGISKPITALVAFARKLESGDYEQDFSETSASEFKELSLAFNNMRLAISAREHQIKMMAYHDTLTGLPNRALFNERLNQAITLGKRLCHPVSVMLIDLNRFKEVNDSLGHHVGDFLLCEVGKRLQAVLHRASDTSARLGGDEFAVILPTTSTKMAEEVVKRVLQSFEKPCFFEGRALDIEGSVGIATFPNHGMDQAILMSHADIAMYHAKRKLLGFVVYDEHLHVQKEVSHHFSLLGELRQAVEKNEFILYYQPRINLSGHPICEVEVLVRWQHPSRGFLPPGEFIPFAEQTGYIREITYWVMDAVFAQSIRWHTQGLAIIISINLSVRDLLNVGFFSRVMELVRQHKVSPYWFRLEITESVIMDNPDRVLETVRQLNDVGFSLSIDDFGTGYSSLAWIKKLQVTELKIDRSFVVNMVTDAEDMIIVRSVIDLAHNMGLQVVAEGVEFSETLEVLREIGCDSAQGYYICKPSPANQLEIWWESYQDNFTK